MPAPLPADHPVRRGVRTLLTQHYLTRSRTVEVSPGARPAAVRRDRPSRTSHRDLPAGPSATTTA